MPQTLTTLEDVYRQVEERSHRLHDELVPVRDIQFDSAGCLQIGHQQHTLAPVAARSISTRLGVPYQYLERCPAQLQAENLNHWLRSEKNKELFFRFDGDEVRAIFTPRYVPIDNLEILQTLFQIGLRPNIAVQVHFDAGMLVLNIPDPQKAFDLPGNDRLMPGLSIANSEVGLSSLSVSAYLLRLVCTNGLIARENIGSTSHRHISEKTLRQLPAILTQVHLSCDQQQHRLKISRETPVEDPVATIAAFNRQFQLGRNEREAVDWAWPQEEGETMFNVINAYTKGAQHPELDAEGAYRLQKTGGRLLEMVRAN